MERDRFGVEAMLDGNLLGMYCWGLC